MDLSVVILNYKQKGLLKQCLKGIIAAQPRLKYEIIIVDNNSNDDCLAMVEQMFVDWRMKDNRQLVSDVKMSLSVPPLKTIQSEINGGFAAGNNLGIEQSAGRYVMILNPDIAVTPGILEKMVEYLETNAQVGLIGPKLINPDGSVQYSCRRFPKFLTPLYRRTFFGKIFFAKKEIERYLMMDYNHQEDIEVDWLFGACLLIRKSALAKVGNFDSRFFMYFEDLDLCRRFWQAAFKVVYLAQVEMVHYHQRFSAERGGILGILSRGGRIHVISGIKYFIKYFRVKLPIRG
jgi:hypothetical protein